MSWWGTGGFTNIASQASKALKNAQKQIDKVLDIDEGEGQAAGPSTSLTQDSSWSSDSWSSWSMSWDTGQEKQAKSEPTSLSQDKPKTVSTKEVTKPLSLKSQEIKKVESKTASEKTGKKLELQESATPRSSKGDNFEKMTLGSSENVGLTESETSTQIDDSKSCPDQKMISEKELVHESCSLVTNPSSGSADRLSPLSHGSGETVSSESHSYEKVPSAKSSTDVLTVHSINSGDEISDFESATKLSDLVADEKQNQDTQLTVAEDSLEDIKLNSETAKADNHVVPEDSGDSVKLENSDDGVKPESLGKNSEDGIKPENSGDGIEPENSGGGIEPENSGGGIEPENSGDGMKPDGLIEGNISKDLTAEVLPMEGTSNQPGSSICEPDNALSHEQSVKSFEPTEEEVKEDIPDSELGQKSLDVIPSEMTLQCEETEGSVESEKHESENMIINSASDENVAASISPVTSYIRSSASESHDELPSSPLANSSSGEGSKLDSSMDTDDTVVDRSAKADSDSMGSVSPSSSYVKCMIEEAMDCNSSDGHSVGKSECSRSTGGHESGDEIDTTTSSDIEIISTPTSNGDSSKFIDLSPLKIALQKTARRSDGSHKRNDSHDSQSSSSSHSRGEQLSPGRDTDSSEDGVEMKITSEEAKAPLCRELPPLDEEVADPYNTQKLLKKLAEMAEVLQAREDKLLVLSKENMDLMETNNILRNQMQQLEETQALQSEDVDNVTHEFTKRLSESEKLCQQAIREKDAIKKQNEEMQADFQKRLVKLENALKEKEQITAELMQEGEKLSKQQLQSNTIIKKLRSKEKETDSLTSGYRKKIDDQTKEIEHLKTCLDSKEEMEKKQTEAINQLNTAVQKQERELSKLRSIETDSTERVRGLQAALDNSYKEIAELNKMKAALDSQAQADALSQEMQIREELKATLEREQHSFKQERESLYIQIEDLRLSMQRMEKEQNRREDMLKQEISDLQFQLQEDEARNQDLSQSVTSATRPLLRQIENLQSTFAQQSASWEKVEKNLSDRLYEAQTQLAAVTERERSASEKLMDIGTQITSLESQNSSLRQDKSQLTAQIEIFKSKTQVLEDAKNSEVAQLEAFKQQTLRDMGELRKEKVFLETQLDMEKTKLEQEKKKFMLAQEQITQLERDTQRPQSRSSTHSPVSISRTESVSSYSEPPNLMLASFTQDDIDRNFLLGPQKTSLYESLRQSGAANLLENLQSRLKLREGEITQLQSDIQQLERTRESMARELVNLTNQNEVLEEKVKELPALKDRYQELDQRYNALLQMYGEKVEEADELRMDLNDVKEMYKMQIDHLLAK